MAYDKYGWLWSFWYFELLNITYRQKLKPHHLNLLCTVKYNNIHFPLPLNHYFSCSPFTQGCNEERPAPPNVFFTWCCLGWNLYFEHKFSTVNICTAEQTCRKWDWTIQLLSLMDPLTGSCQLYTHSFYKDTHTCTDVIFVHYVSHLFESLNCEKHPRTSDFDIMLIIHLSHHSQHGICSQAALLRWIWQFPSLFW